jgi:regulator of RNase E activity RraA
MTVGIPLNQVEDLAHRYRQVGTAAVYSALEELGAPINLFSLAIKPIRPDGIIAGPAFTLKGARDPRTHHTADTELEKFADYAMFRAMTPGCVIVADPGHREIVGCWGDLMSAAAQASGAGGFVIDGGARDTRQLVQMDHFPVFARYTSMVSTERRVLWIDFQIPVGIGGTLTNQVEVRPGDWIYGDADGTLVIPPDLVEPVLVHAEEAEAKEELIRRDFVAGMPVWEVYPKHRRL